MVTPLEQFRAQYPDGGLIADLVSIHDGQYVVRAAVTYKGETLATGLSANPNIQIAEDQARDRAISALGITLPTSASPQPAQPQSTATFTSPVATNPPKKSLNSNPTTEPSQPASQPVSQPQLIPDDELPPEPPEDDFGPPIDSITENAAALVEPDAAASPIAKPSAATLALENFNTSPHPVDLSDVIAQTDVELTRLGWTSAQGREYLEETYGKRSRQQLTDEELMSFLLYLEEK